MYKKVCDKAIELSCNNLINYEYYLREDGKRLSTNQEDLLHRFVERTYQTQLENAYITKVNTVYLKNEALSNESIINAFKAMYESDYAKYANDLTSYNEKVISIARERAEVIKNKVEELYSEAKAKATPVIQKTVEDLKAKTVIVLKDTVKKLEEPKKDAPKKEAPKKEHNNNQK